MGLKIKGLDQITAWIGGIVIASIIVGITIYIGRSIDSRRELRKVQLAKEAESILAATMARQQLSSAKKAETEENLDTHESESTGDRPRSQVATIPYGYTGPQAPWRWSDIQEDWKICGTGKKQSPIDISGAKMDAKLKALKFNYQHGTTKLFLANQTLQGSVEFGSWLDIDGDRYDLKHVTFHTPSEHRVNGLPYEMEIQFHHQELSGKRAAVAVLIAAGSSNSSLSRMEEKLPRYEGEESVLDRFQWTDIILSKKRTYWQYTGSLTTPPCTEGINWIVLTETTPATTKEIDKISALQKNNARPTQELHGRPVHRSNR